jgi:hypothetical protein
MSWHALGRNSSVSERWDPDCTNASLANERMAVRERCVLRPTLFIKHNSPLIAKETRHRGGAFPSFV